MVEEPIEEPQVVRSGLLRLGMLACWTAAKQLRMGERLMQVMGGVSVQNEEEVKAMTQEMLGGTKEMLAENSGGKSGTGGIWKMRELRTFLYAMPFKTEAGDVGIYAQAVYPDVTVSKHQHTVPGCIAGR